MAVMTELVALEQERRAKRPAELQAVMDQATDDLAASGMAGGFLQVGDVAPDFVLPDVLGNAVALGDLRAQGPVALSFYRGAWCPYCNLEVQLLQQALPDIQALGATLVAISPQTPDNSLSLAEKHGLAFPVLSDAGNAVARRFGLVFTVPEALRAVYDKLGIDIPAHNGDGSFELPVPGTYVVGRDGTIAFAYANVDYTRRVAVRDILAALRTAS
ncbi:MAG: AhpC/TSA family protein [Caldilineaceae bacterium]|nr:AhpC/TSA family protein [Caldilinea sp.]MCB9117098.1 AhpC/TSA family protein [Caldilineaceae bacterium]MCB9118821.1 AhpC/TSA family protein [Caldilineaceae bacterium]MCB9124992.1 AhpC/TSA family protein [Caldilineaceae bacterium]